MASRTIAGVHGITPFLYAAGCYVHTTKTGRKVAISDKTYRLLKARRQK